MFLHIYIQYVMMSSIGQIRMSSIQIDFSTAMDTSRPHICQRLFHSVLESECVFEDKFTMNFMFLVLTRLLQKTTGYQFVLDEDKKQSILEPKTFGFFLEPKPYSLILEKI